MCKHADLLRVEANEGESQCENRFLSLSLSFFQHLSNDFVQVDDIRSLSFSLQLLFCFGFFSPSTLISFVLMGPLFKWSNSTKIIITILHPAVGSLMGAPFLEFEESCVILQQVVKMKGQSKIVVTLHCDVANCFRRFKKNRCPHGSFWWLGSYFNQRDNVKKINKSKLVMVITGPLVANCQKEKGKKRSSSDWLQVVQSWFGYADD